jgi:hypothetical protein
MRFGKIDRFREFATNASRFPDDAELWFLHQFLSLC